MSYALSFRDPPPGRELDTSTATTTPPFAAASVSPVAHSRLFRFLCRTPGCVCRWCSGGTQPHFITHPTDRDEQARLSLSQPYHPFRPFPLKENPKTTRNREVRVSLLSSLLALPEHRERQQCTRDLARHAWLGAKDRHVHCDVEDVHCFVKQALRMWHGRKIPRDSVERSWRGDTDGEHCSLVQVIDNELRLFSPLDRNLPSNEIDWMSDLFAKRVEAFVGVTKTAMSLGPLPDLEFTFCVGDCVAQNSPELPEQLEDNAMDASFAVVQCLGSSTIPFPLFDVFRPPNDVSLYDWPEEVRGIKRHRESIPWEDRIPKAVFRGGVRTCHVCATPEGYHLQASMVPKEAFGDRRCGRARALELARADDAAAVLDFAETGLDMPGHEAYQYVMYLHGECHWANRLRRLLFMGMAILKQEGICEEFYGMRLQPWVHYIPVDYNLRNMTKAVEWALRHEPEVRTMVRRTQAYAEAFDTSEFAVGYTYHLLREYASLLDYRVEAREGGQLRR